MVRYFMPLPPPCPDHDTPRSAAWPAVNARSRPVIDGGQRGLHNRERRGGGVGEGIAAADHESARPGLPADFCQTAPAGVPGASAGAIFAGPHPDVPFVHEFDLPVYHLAPVVLVPVGGPVEVEVLRVDRRFVDELVLLGGQVLDPIVPLRVRAE